MKNYSRKPTDDNVLQLLKSDAIGRNKDIIQFIKLLSNMENDCYSIALNGEWGSGKTFFIKQVKLLLDANNPFHKMSGELRETVKEIINFDDIPESYTTVYYDAWINDNHEDPILSLVYATIKSNQSDFALEKNRSLSRTISALASVLSGHDISTLFQELEGEDAFSDFKTEGSTRNFVKEFIDELIHEHGNRLVFFIDELDRCKPDYAIRFLERIKHYFDDDRITFVFAVSLSQLQSTVKRYYGSEFDATRYLDKFFELRISLRSIDVESFLNKQFNLDQNIVFDAVCIESAKYFNFSLREIERYVRMVKIAGNYIKKQTRGFYEETAKHFALNYVVPIILALQMYDISLYNKFMAALEPEPMVDILLMTEIDIYANYFISTTENYNNASKTIMRNDGQEPIHLSERLKEFYSAIFSKTSKLERNITIGKMTFGSSTRHHIEEISSMLSPQSDYQFE